MPLITLRPTERIVELPFGAPLTSLEDDPRGDGVIPFGCRVGSCGSCVVEILAGASSLDPADADERTFLDDLGYASGDHRLACRCRVDGDVTIFIPALADEPQSPFRFEEASP